MTEIQPIYGIPALMIGCTLVIGDLHIGEGPTDDEHGSIEQQREMERTTFRTI